jgi:hypothetical protein
MCQMAIRFPAALAGTGSARTAQLTSANRIGGTTHLCVRRDRWGDESDARCHPAVGAPGGMSPIAAMNVIWS